MSITEDRYARLKGIGESAIASIREMAGALTSPYDRENTPETLARETLSLPESADDADDDNPFAPLTDDQWEEALEELNESDPEDRKEAARERIMEDPLSLEFRSGWETSPADFTAAEFCLLLTTGGPAVRIIGEIESGEPNRPRLQVQDWGTVWTDHLRTAVASVSSSDATFAPACVLPTPDPPRHGAVHRRRSFGPVLRHHTGVEIMSSSTLRASFVAPRKALIAAFAVAANNCPSRTPKELLKNVRVGINGHVRFESTRADMDAPLRPDQRPH